MTLDGSNLVPDDKLNPPAIVPKQRGVGYWVGQVLCARHLGLRSINFIFRFSFEGTIFLYLVSPLPNLNYRIRNREKSKQSS